MISALKTKSGQEQRFAYAYILVFIILAAMIVATGYFYYGNYAKHYRSEMERRISAIAELKKSDLVQWRKERMADATVFYSNAVFSTLVQRYFEKPEDAEAQKQLQRWLSKLQQSDQYARVLLLDAHGVVKMFIPEAPAPVASILTQRISETLQAGQVAFVDFFKNEADQRIYLAMLVPVLDGEDGKQRIGLLALLIDPEQYLYPYINRWPTTDKTAETLLVRRDGNDVLFLNELLFNTNAALSVRMPLTNTEVAAVKAAMGKEGIVEAIDYRGVPIMADVHAIPDSPWFMVTREDTSELYAPLRERLRMIIAIAGILLTLAGLSVGLIQRQQKVRFYLMQYETIKKMHESEEDLAITLRSIGDAVIATDTQGRVTRMNPVAEKLTGWPLAEAAGKPLKDVFHIINAQTRAPVQNPLEKVITSGLVVGLANHTALIARDGTVRQIADSAAPIRDEEGSIRGVVLVFHDVTDEYNIKAEIQRAKEDWELTFDAVTDLISIIDTDHHIKRVNKAMADKLGLKPEEVIGRLCYENVHGTSTPIQSCPHALLLKDGRTHTAEIHEPHLNGDFQVTCSPLHNAAGKLIGSVHVARDITKSKQTEAALREAKAGLEEKVAERTRELKEAQDRIVRSEKLAVVGQLASSVAHELRNPLGVMKNAVYYLNMLELGKDNPDIQENLGIISVEIENSDKVISDLLEFSRIKQPALRPEEINLIIKETLNRVSAPAGITIVTKLGDNLPPIQADALQLQMVFFNLAVNAIQAMEKGGTLAISTKRQMSENGAQIEIAFRDTGVGIPKENLQKIFEPLFSTKTKGTGLGLSVVASLVEGHGGKIEIESEAGKGSIFTVKLPVK